MVEKNKKGEVIQKSEDNQLENWGEKFKIHHMNNNHVSKSCKMPWWSNLNKVGKAETTYARITIYLND